MSNFIFSGDLITGKDAFNWLKNNLSQAHGMSSIASCYLKEEALRQLIGVTSLKGRILTRWRLNDLIQGSSDLNAYQVAIDKGWSFYISQNFHGKVYQLPGIGTLVGSANATLSGLSIFSAGNDEVATIVTNTDRNERVVNDLFRSSTLLTSDLFTKISSVVSELKKDHLVFDHLMLTEWPTEISKFFIASNQNGLFVSDCFSAPHSKNPTQSDLSLLGLKSIECADEIVSSALSNTKIYQWLTKNCLNAGGALRYGELTHLLHSDLLDDPLPYRSSIKELLSHLLSWVSYYKKGQFKISRPNHTQVIQLL